jgi:hypothetical protein
MTPFQEKMNDFGEKPSAQKGMKKKIRKLSVKLCSRMTSRFSRGRIESIRSGQTDDRRRNGIIDDIYDGAEKKRSAGNEKNIDEIRSVRVFFSKNAQYEKHQDAIKKKSHPGHEHGSRVVRFESRPSMRYGFTGSANGVQHKRRWNRGGHDVSPIAGPMESNAFVYFVKPRGHVRQCRYFAVIGDKITPGHVKKISEQIKKTGENAKTLQ